MAHSLKLDIVAEGIEPDAQLEFLHARHCNFAQGFYLGKPMSVKEFTSLVAYIVTVPAQVPSSA